MFWGDYQRVLFEHLNLNQTFYKYHNENNTSIHSKLYSTDTILKSRETYIDNGKSFIYNNIIYPKTGSNLPCLGIDLMAFMEKKVIIVFDFQHPKDHYEYHHPIVDDNMSEYLDITKDIRFFEAGNHFSRYVYVKKCTMSEVGNYLTDFAKYVRVFAELVDHHRPSGSDESEYCVFDQYMLQLDPVSGFMESNFGKEFAERYVHDFLFSYAKMPL
jgi:hypothetical protein